MQRRKSLAKNGLLNGIRSVVSIIVPLISFHYASNILGVDKIGIYNFSNSIVYYFSFLAALGITAYSIREGARIREYKKALEKFASEIFTINCISTLFAYILLVLSMVFSRKLDAYRVIICICSLQIVFKTIGVEWLYSIYEDYFFITIRSIAFSIGSLLLLYFTVKSKNDLTEYAFVNMFAIVGSGIVDFILAKKYCRITITLHPNIKKHIIPILLIFAQNLSVLIYVNSDVTLIGLLSSDYYVGLYSLSTNVYKGIKTFLSAMIIVTIPRFSYFLGRGMRNEFNATLKRITYTMLTFVFPIIVGIVMLSEEIVLLLANENFIKSVPSLRILSFATLFCMLSYIYGQCIMIPMHKEKLLTIITVFSAITNILLNLLLIPKYNERGAAITTIIAEAMVFFLSAFFLRNDVKLFSLFKSAYKPVLGSLLIIPVCIGIKSLQLNSYLTMTLCILASTTVYSISQYIVRNTIIMDVKNAIVRRIRR